MSEQVESLSSIFSSATPPAEAPAPAVEAPPAEAPPEPAKVEAQRDASGRFTKAEEPKVEPKPESKPELKPADVAAIIDERRKRQQAEQKLRELESAKPKTDFWEDPDKALSERAKEYVGPLQNEIFDLRRRLARAENPDFDEVVVEFLKAAQTDEVLKYQADNAPDPWDFIYREGKRLKALAPYGGDFSKYADGITAELKGELGKRDEQIKALTAELEAMKKAKAELEAIPRSLNKGNDPAPRSKAEADDDDIKSIVRFNSRSS